MKKDILEELSKGYIKRAEKDNIDLESDAKTLKNTVEMDIRDNIPPQLMSIVSGIVNLVEELEGQIYENKKN